jgi:hypothetical protein
MRNLKKILALALALVMTMSVMSFASAAKAGTTYSDDDSITQYDEAIQVLTALGIYRGDDFGKFRPESTITRGEAAALVYRIVSTDVSDAQINLYKDYGKFDDVKSDDWFAPYVNYCYNGQYIVGNGDGTFNPNGNITGYQILAIILRALGYGQNSEFTGNGWEIRTATLAKQLGITATVNENDLSNAATRGEVAELLFRGLTCTQTVDYTDLLGYTSGYSQLTGKATHGTLGYEKFGLRGFVDNDAYEDYYEETTDKDYDDKNVTYVGNNVIDLDALTSRANAVADNSDDNNDASVAAKKYGEPVAFWYADTVKTTTNTNGAIAVRFNPVATYTTKVAETTLFAATGKSGTSVTVAKDNYNTDGENDASATLNKTVAKASDVVWFGGQGTVTELYVADGTTFLVVKNTYIDQVDQAYSEKYSRKLLLANEGLDIESFTDQKKAIANGLSNVTGLTEDSYVIFNMYAGDVDIETVHTADSKTVTLTNSYVKDDDDAENSYFMVGSTKYVYNSNALDTALDYELLDRNELLQNGSATQDVYFDDYGNVIYSEDSVSSAIRGYMVVTNATYGGYDKDNGYYMTIKGYDLNGKSVSIKGGFDGDYVYANKTDAADYNAGIGLYYYEYDADVEMYTLYDTDQPEAATIVDLSANDCDDIELLAGDPDALDDDALMDSTTVFVIANYSAKGAITGYTVKTGIKNIPDMVDANMAKGSNGVIYDTSVAYTISYIDNDLNAKGEGDGIIDLVLVLGADSESDTNNKTKNADLDDVIYLLDTTPLKQFSAYNEYAAIQDGKVTTVKVAVSAENGAAGNYVALMDEVGFWSITTNSKDYIIDAEQVDGGEMEYAGKDILSFDGLGDVTTIWKLASCHIGAGDEDGDCSYVVLADNCKIYDLTNGALTEIDAEDLYIDPDLDENALGYESVTGVVASWNGYGFATAIYIVDSTND